MFFKVLADIVVLIHFLWIVFLFLGGLWGVKYKAVRIFHLAGLAFALTIQIFGWYCPLTHLEFWLRMKHNPYLIYPGSFIVYYMEKIVYVEVSRSVIFVCTLFLIAFNGWLYLKKKK